jgi:hypothetical protein
MQNLANLAASAWRVIAIDQGGGKWRGLGCASLEIASCELWRGFAFVNSCKVIAGTSRPGVSY